MKKDGFSLIGFASVLLLVLIGGIFDLYLNSHGYERFFFIQQRVSKNYGNNTGFLTTSCLVGAAFALQFLIKKYKNSSFKTYIWVLVGFICCLVIVVIGSIDIYLFFYK